MKKSSAAREIASTLAVVAGLAFVGLELRNNAVAARAAAYQEIGIATSSAWLTGVENPDVLIAMFLESRDSTFELPISARTQAALFSRKVAAWRLWEVVFLQVEEGLLPESALRSLGWGASAWPSPTEECLWDVMRPDLSAEFIEFAESIGTWGNVDCSAWLARGEAAVARWLQEEARDP